MRTDWHADDFGATPSVNRNILATWLSGPLNSLSIIANGDAVDQGAAEVNRHSDRQLRLIVHLNLSEGPPLADPASVPLLVNDRGSFYMGFIGLWLRWIRLQTTERTAFIDQVETEWALQIKRVQTAFAPRVLSGLDGHIHVQMLPFLFPVAARLARRFALPDIRISRELFHFSLRETLRPGYPVNAVKHLLLNSLAGNARQLQQNAGLQSPDSIAGVLYSGCMSLATAQAAMDAAKNHAQKWQELVFHPGHAEPGETFRWKESPTVGKFYMDPGRTRERDELLRMNTTRK